MSIFLLSCFALALLSHLPFPGFRLLLGALKFESFWKKKKRAVVPGSLRELELEPKPSLLDLPELTLECILEKLSPAGLCSMSAVCSSMRERCRSDRLWEKHMEQKWRGLIGDAARVEWERRIFESRRRPDGSQRRKGLRNLVLSFCWSLWIRKRLWNEVKRSGRNPLPPNSVMALYLSLEGGKFWFPAQVYNRENGHSGFMLSCYDAHICYDSPTDTFLARYSSQGGRRTMEESVPWNRIRSPPVNTPPYELHVSDCLNDLKPSDHIEIQWRKSKEFPYGWWYGVVGHLESCSGSDECCHCIYSGENSNSSSFVNLVYSELGSSRRPDEMEWVTDAVMLEFNHYPEDSRWRRKVVNREKHPEEGDQITGFYGGIRKLDRAEEIIKWKSLWPSRVSE